MVHARYSTEKKKERGARLPPLSDYLPASASLLAQANTTRLFLQTSTPDAVDLFERWSTERRWSLSYTQNARSSHDLWMGGTGKKAEYASSGERASVVAQAVNALIASRSRYFLSPSSSMWTSFIRALMGRRVGDRVVNANEKQQMLYDDCLKVFYDNNVSSAEYKHCRSIPVPKLLPIRRITVRNDSKERSP